MIIWGIKSKIVDGNNIEDIECPNCRKREFSSFGIIKFIHIFWIPICVISKKVTLECSNCKTIVSKKELGSKYFKFIKKEIFKPSITIPKNFGIILFGTIVLIFTIMVISNF